MKYLYSFKEAHLNVIYIKQARKQLNTIVSGVKGGNEATESLSAYGGRRET